MHDLASNPRARAEAHFRARCRERRIPLSVERISWLMARMRPCWERPGQERVVVRVRFQRGSLAHVVWDCGINAPVTAYWSCAHDSGSEGGVSCGSARRE